MPPELVLRPAGPADEERLLGWRNEPEVRAASFNEEAVGPEEHARWLARTLSDPDVRLLIVELEGRPVGQVRLERSGEGAEVHVALSGEARGRGLGTGALELAAEVARDDLGVRALSARIRPGNERSMRAFRAAGFTEAGGDASELRMMRPL